MSEPQTIAIKFHQDVPYGYLVTAHILIVWKKHQRKVTQKLRKREQSFLYATHCLDLIHIAIQYGYLHYGKHKDSMKKKSKGSNSKTKKGRTIFFVRNTTLLPHTHCFKVSWRYSIQLPTYGTHRVNQKFYQREVIQKLRKGKQSFLYATHPLNLIHIAIKFNQDVLYGNLLMVHLMSVKNLIKGK